MAIAMCGKNKCASISIPGKIMTSEEIYQEIKDGKICFGFVSQDIEKVVPIIIKEIMK